MLSPDIPMDKQFFRNDCFIYNMRISDSIPTFFQTTPFAIPFVTKPDSVISVKPEQKTDNSDTFVRSITPKGTSDPAVLAKAPKPDITIAGEKKKAGIIVDIDTNTLYTYDEKGNPTKAYLVASGKKSTPTDRGIRIVTHKEKYPYRSAVGTKRRRSPKDYGPFVVILKKIDPATGEQTKTGEFIHGCRSYQDTFETDPGRYVSHGCIRMDNEAIVEVKEVKSGTIVIIK